MSVAPDTTAPETPGQASDAPAGTTAATPSQPSEAGWEILLQATQKAKPTTDRAAELRRGAEDASTAAIEGVAGAREFKWPDRGELLGYCREADSILAAVLLFLGLAFSVFGLTLFKLVVTVNVAGLGVWAGFLVGRMFDARLPGMVIGGLLFAALAWPAMRFAVAACAGLVGFVVGVALWRALGMADAYAPAGGAIGAIFLFMLSFSLFKLSVLAFTAIQGATMLVGGLLGLLLKYPRVDEPVVRWTTEQPALLPITLLSLSVVALLFQQQWHKQAKEEE